MFPTSSSHLAAMTNRVLPFQKLMGAMVLWALPPQAVLDRRIWRNKEEVLIHWQGMSPAEATWEDARAMRLCFPDIALEDKDQI